MSQGSRRLRSVVLLGAVLAGLLTGPVRGAPGADIVFVIDQSGSMWGHSQYAHAANDPSAYRLAVVELALNCIAARVRGTSDIYSMSVVEFATRARVSLPAVEFGFDPAAPAALDQLVASSFAKLGNLASLGDERNIDEFLTDTPKAFALARSEMTAMMRSEQTPGRRHVIVLITDGRPYRSGALREDVFREAAQQVSGALADGVDQFRVLGINDIGGSDLGYWQGGDGSRWQSIVGSGHAERVDPVGDKLPKRVESIMDEVLGTQSSTALGQQFTVGPYESRLAVMVTLEKVTSAVPALILPDGSARAPQVPGLGASRTGARSLAFDVPNPPPGTYSVRFERDTLGSLVTGQVARSLTHARASLTTPGTLFAGRKAELQFQAVGASDSDRLPFRPEWPLLSAAAQISSAAPGVTETVPLTWDATGLLRGTWMPRRSGTFTVAVEATFRAADGSVQPLFAKLAVPGSITVADRSPFVLVPTQTANTRLTVTPLGSQSIELRFQLHDSGAGGGRPIASLLRTPDKFALLRLLDSSGRPVPDSSDISLRHSGEDLVARVPIAFNWWAGEGWMPGRRTRTLLVGITANANAISPGQIYGGVEIPPGSGFTRVRTLDPQNTLGGFKVVGSIWPFVVLAAVGAVMLVLLAAWFCRRVLLVRLEDGRRNKAVKLVIFQATGGAFVGPGAKTFDLTGRRTLNLDRQIQLRTQAGNSLLEKLRVERLSGDGRNARAEMRIRARGGKRDQVIQLRSGEGRPPVPVPGIGDGWSVALMLEPMRQQR